VLFQKNSRPNTSTTIRELKIRWHTCATHTSTPETNKIVPTPSSSSHFYTTPTLILICPPSEQHLTQLDILSLHSGFNTMTFISLSTMTKQGPSFPHFNTPTKSKQGSITFLSSYIKFFTRVPTSLPLIGPLYSTSPHPPTTPPALYTNNLAKIPCIVSS
jgi:hypothetical protein